MKPETKKWLDAGFILQKNPSAIVKCPECEAGTLIVKDELLSSVENRIDRYLICDNCGKWNVITMQIPASQQKNVDS